HSTWKGANAVRLPTLHVAYPIADKALELSELESNAAVKLLQIFRNPVAQCFNVHIKRREMARDRVWPRSANLMGAGDRGNLLSELQQMLQQHSRHYEPGCHGCAECCEVCISRQR